MDEEEIKELLTIEKLVEYIDDLFASNKIQESTGYKTLIFMALSFLSAKGIKTKKEIIENLYLDQWEKCIIEIEKKDKE